MAPSPSGGAAVRHAWLTEQIRAVHTASRGTYGLVHVLTAPERVGICPKCGERPTRPKGVQTGRYCDGASESGCAPV